MIQYPLLLPTPGQRRIVNGEHASDCGCDWCMMDYDRSPNCNRCGLRGRHECVPDVVTVAGMRLGMMECGE